MERKKKKEGKGGGRLETASGDVLAYLTMGEAAGWVCSSEIMTDEQTGPAENSMAHVALETGAAIGSHMLATRQGWQTFAAPNPGCVSRDPITQDNEAYHCRQWQIMVLSKRTDLP